MTTGGIEFESESRPAAPSLETPAKRIRVDVCASSLVKGGTMATSVTPASSEISNVDNGCPPLSDDQIQSLLKHEAAYDCKADNLTPKRSEYLSWDDYFMAIARLSAQRSKDPKTPTGACIVNEENRVIGIGYNGFPRSCSDDALPWVPSRGNETAWLHTSTPYECHAEVNAILNKCSADVVGARLYVAQFPCNECTKVIIQSRIREVVYLHDKDADKETYRASRIMLAMAGVATRRFTPGICSIPLNLTAEMDTPIDIPSCDKPAATYDPLQYRSLLLEEANLDPTTTPSTKRANYLTWDDYFMAVAFLTAKRSKDPNTQVGACIVDKNKCIIGLGYNGFPRGCSDDHLPWSRKPNPGTPGKHAFLHKKYAYVCHAEVNAILNKCSADVKDATLYVALFPCNECAKVIIQSGIREVVYLSDRYHDDEPFRASRILFNMAGVKLRQHVPNVGTVVVTLCDSDND